MLPGLVRQSAELLLELLFRFRWILRLDIEPVQIVNVWLLRVARDQLRKGGFRLSRRVDGSCHVARPASITAARFGGGSSLGSTARRSAAMPIPSTISSL